LYGRWRLNLGVNFFRVVVRSIVVVDLFQPLAMTRSFLQNVFAHYQFPFRVRTIFKGDRPPPRGPLKETRSKLALQTYKRGVPRAPCQVRLLPVLDCKKMFSSSRKMRQRNPSHFGSYIHSLPMGKLFTARAFIGVIGGLKNLSIELLEVTTQTEFYFIWCNEHPPLPTTSFSSFAQFF
jgi:hypothetical protein